MVTGDCSADLGRAALTRHLAWAEQQVAEARAGVARQRGLVAELAASGGNPRTAAELLTTAEAVLRAAQAYRADVLREIGLQAGRRSGAVPTATGSRAA